MYRYKNYFLTRMVNNMAADDIRQMQAYLDERTKVEQQVYELIAECKFMEALDLLDTLDNMPELPRQ